jgi:hypothetical protein
MKKVENLKSLEIQNQKLNALCSLICDCIQYFYILKEELLFCSCPSHSWIPVGFLFLTFITTIHLNSNPRVRRTGTEDLTDRNN